MKISYNWLKNYIITDLSAEEMAVILTDIGLEVEGFEKIETLRGGLAGVVVGEVLTCTDHPDSDHLHLTSVGIGTEEPLQIVCGAPNVRQGQKVLVATINTTLYPIGSEEPFKIKKSKIRGVESYGMICAEDELGIGTGHAGIMELDPAAVPGTPAREYLGIEDDYLIEIGLTPNRVDAASHYGVARDLYAYLKSKGKPAKLVLPSVEGFSIDNHDRETRIEVLDSKAAPRYAGITVTGVRTAPSPDWMQKYLRAVGINPKNNLVDITNFILHELGQPLHAFDADKIRGGKIVVRTAPEGTPFVTLDGVERKLDGNDLMICDSEQPMCIAGVFGGQNSGIGDDTVNVFIESAYFNPVWVRKTAKRHGLNTDASFRFERGIDPDMSVYALKRAAMLMRELAGGKISSDITDIYPVRIEPFRFEVAYERIDALIGKEIPRETVREILATLDVKIEAEKDGVLSVAVPPYRVDVQREADLVEDILRIYGYNNVEISDRVHATLSYRSKPDKDRIVNIVSDFLSDNGYTEIMSNSLTKAAYYENLTTYPVQHCVKILNPLSNDLNVMRQTLLFNALEAVSLNANRRNADLKLYELGNCYHYDPTNNGTDGLAPYRESYRLGITVTGNLSTATWNGKARMSDFFTLKAISEKLLRRFGMDPLALKHEPLASDLFDEGMSVLVNGKELYRIGVVSTSIRNMFDLKNEVYFLELDFDRLLALVKKNKITVEEISKFPEVRRDLALLIDKSVTFAALHDIAFATERKLLKNVSLFDVYEGDKLPEGKKSYALSFILEDRTKTLTDAVIDRIMKNMIQQFETKAGAQIRS